MDKLKIILVYLLAFLVFNAVNASDYLLKDTVNLNKELLEYLSYFEDTTNELSINEIVNQNKFKDSPISINLGISTSAHWFKTKIINTLNKDQTLYLEVRNPDIAHINFYVFDSTQKEKEIKTGDLHKTSTKEIFNRQHLIKIDIKAKQAKTIYLRVKNEGLLYSPVFLLDEQTFNKNNSIFNYINWFIYGIIFFICFFNIYLFRSNNNKTNMYITAYIFSGLLFLIYYDGYHFLLNMPAFNRTFKYFPIYFFSFFMLMFAKSFTYQRKLKSGYIRILDVILFANIILPIALFFDYPIAHIGEQGARTITGISILAVVSISIITVNKKDLPSKIILMAHLILLTAFLIVQFKEFGLFEYSILTESSIKIGLAVQNIFLTVAVLEQIRISQHNSRLTIEKNLKQIDQQNKELEFINVELEQLSVVASKTNNAVAICGADGKLEWCNLSFEKYLDNRQIDILDNGNIYYQAIFPYTITKKQFQNCIDTKKPTTFESKILLPGKKEIYVQTTLTPYLQSKNVFKVFVIDSDITELKRYEQRLYDERKKALEADRLKTVFLRNMSHEVRTPLNGIIGFSDLINNLETSNKATVKDYTDLIKSNSLQLQYIIDDILDISLIESDQLKVNLVPCNLEDIIINVHKSFHEYQITHNKQHIELSFTKRINQPENTIIISDPDRIRQILTNLVKNAFKFTQVGEISITLSDTEKDFLISVEDNGIGVDPVKETYIFQQFRQGDEELSRKYGGTGLGLPICKGILEKLGGDVWLDTKHKNGARFVFNIPKP